MRVIRAGRSRLSRAAILIALGIAIELVTLHWSRPMAFLVFMFIASPLQFIGILLYLSSILVARK